MSTPATLYDGCSAAPAAVLVEVERAVAAPRLRLRREGFPDAEYAVLELRADERVGGALRLVQLPDGGTLEVAADPAFDAALAAAARVPAAAEAKLGMRALELLDGQMLAASGLPAERREELTRLFATLVAADPAAAGARLEFRDGDAIGANALALPGGIVVLTDELVALAEHDDELRAVLAHELGHVVHRHGLRMLIQGSIAALVVGGLLGDVTGLSSLAVAVPTVLVQGGYSRHFEREADEYAFARLREAGVSTGRLVDLLERLVREPDGGAVGWLSTHPSTAERREAAGAAH